MSTVSRALSDDEWEDNRIKDYIRKSTILDDHLGNIARCALMINQLQNTVSTSQSIVTRMKREMAEIEESFNDE